MLPSGLRAASLQVIEESHADKQSTLPVRSDGPILDPAWTVKPVTLDDLVLAYMGQPRDTEHNLQQEFESEEGEEKDDLLFKPH